MTDDADPTAGDAASEPEAEAAAPPPTKQLGWDDLVVLHKQIRDLVDAEAALPEGLKTFGSELAGGSLESVVATLRAELQQGKTLSEAAAKCGAAFPPIYVKLLEAGERSGDLSGVLELLIDQAEADAEIDDRVREALLYPTITLGLALVTGVGTIAIVGPTFRPIFDNMGVELPLMTKMFLNLGDIARPLLIPVFILAVAIIAFAPKLLKALTRSVLGPLLLPPLKLRHLGGMARSLAGFLARGVPAAAAVGSIRRAYGDHFAPQALENIEQRLEGGSSLADAFRPEAAAIPPTFVWVVGMAETQGTLPAALLDLARRYEDGFRRRVAVVAAFLTPALIVILGAFIGGFVLSVFLPIFELQKALGS